MGEFLYVAVNAEGEVKFPHPKARHGPGRVFANTNPGPVRAVASQVGGRVLRIRLDDPGAAEILEAGWV